RDLPAFPPRRSSDLLLDRRESSLGSREADKVFTEIVEPPAQLHRSVVCGVGSYKNEFDLIGHTGGQSLQSRPNICHVHGALIGADRKSTRLNSSHVA